MSGTSHTDLRCLECMTISVPQLSLCSFYLCVRRAALSASTPPPQALFPLMGLEQLREVCGVGVMGV